MRLRLKHVKVAKARLADGTTKVYRYHRLTGRPITGEPGSTEFLQSYERAADNVVRAKSETLAWLAEKYKRSIEFADLADRTRRDYDDLMQTIVAEFGDVPLGALDDKRIRVDFKETRDRLAKVSRRRADYWTTVLSVVLSYGVDSGLLEHNHARGLSKLYRSERADKIWLEPDVIRFAACASDELLLALHLGLHTGQRQGDLLRLSWTAYDGKGITLKQRKTGARVYVPCTSALRTALDTAPRRAVTVLTNSAGFPWSEDGFRSSWGKASRRAGLVDLTFNDLRGTAVTMLSQAGCTPQEIGTITGHSLRSVTSILEHYLARTRPLAEAAILKFEQNAEATKLTNAMTNAPARSREG